MHDWKSFYVVAVYYHNYDSYTEFVNIFALFFFFIDLCLNVLIKIITNTKLLLKNEKISFLIESQLSIFFKLLSKGSMILR